MSKKISELTETSELQDNDVLVVVNENETKKVTILNIISKIKTALNNVYASISHSHEKSDITDFPTIPSKTSELENDSGFMKSYTETDPTVPACVKNITQEDIDTWNNPSGYTLPTASADTLGGVKVGAGLSINNGVLSATGGGTADSVEWDNIVNKPNEFTPATHTHKMSELTNDGNFATTTYVDTAINNAITTAIGGAY